MKPRLYLETTIPSYLAARISRDPMIAAHQRTTHAWWDRRRGDFGIHVSALVLEEAKAGDPVAARRRLAVLEGLPVLAGTPLATELTESLMRKCRLPTRAVLDAAHIAIATVHGMDYLLTWNCAHLANADIVPRVKSVCENLGYVCPVICTPRELMGT